MKNNNGTNLTKIRLKTGSYAKVFPSIIRKYFLLSVLVVSCSLIAKPSYLYAKSVVAQVLLNNAWRQSQQSGDNNLPWQWSDSYPVAKLTNDKSNTDWIILSGMTGRSMAFAPSWLEDSAKPNQYGNTVISAHNDSHFSLLEDTRVGDLFFLEDKYGVIFDYRVERIDIVEERDLSPYHFKDKTMITLITCYPFDITDTPKDKRLVVQAVKYKF